MATVLSLPNEQLRNWTKLSDLNCCEDLNVDFLDGMSKAPTSEFLDWRSQTTSSAASSDSASVSVDGKGRPIQDKQCWKVKQFLHSLKRSWHSQGHVTHEQLKRLPLTLFSSVLDRSSNIKNNNDCHGYFTAPDLVSSQASSETDIINAVFEDHWERTLPFHIQLMRLLRTSRRHYNSESDIPINFTDSQLLKPVVKRPVLDLLGTSCKTKPSEQSPPDLPLNETTTLDSSTDCKISAHDKTNKPVTDQSDVCNPICGVQQNPSLNCISIQLESTNKDKCETVDDKGVTEAAVQACHIKSALKESSENLAASTASAVKLPKSVSFADEVGEELTEVFLIENDENRIPDYDNEFQGYTWNSLQEPRFQSSHFSKGFSRSRLKKRSITLPEVQTTLVSPSKTDVAAIQNDPNNAIFTRCLWVLKFSQPAAKYYEFRQKVENSSVSLENITLTQPEETSITQLPNLSGTIKVKNLSFEKQVWIRLTVDNWQSFTDYVALHSPQLSCGLMNSVNRFDTFTFQINVVPQLEHPDTSDRIEFAIRYLVGHDGSCGQYWDSNGGTNYIIEKKLVQSNLPPSLGEFTRNSSPTLREDALISSHTGYGTNSRQRAYTSDYRPNFEGITQFTNYRAWTHFADETTYY